jgi:subtilisin family serine protease
VKIAIMDSGVDYTLPEFGGGSFPNSKVIGGFDFVGDNYNANPANTDYQPIPHPDPDPAPCDPVLADQQATRPGNGTSAAAHGTHVAGIAAADGRGHADEGQVTGVAPAAKVLAYRVFGCNGSTDEDVMIAAMERSLADGAHVLNMSIGSAFQAWAGAPTAAAASALASAGVVVVASIGNSGPSGLYAAGAPGVGTNVIGVASFDNVRVTGPAFRIDGIAYPYIRAGASPPYPTTGTFPIVATGTITSPADGCAAFPAGSLAGKIAMIRRGTCGFYNKAKNAELAGAVGVVLYNNQPGVLNPTVAGSPAVVIPVAAVPFQALGNQIVTSLTPTSTFSWTDETADTANPTGNLISDFSSYGTDAELNLKPDLGGPGGAIYSTWPHQQYGGHNSIGGTSMSSPHVAGAVALYLQKYPGSSWEQVRTAFQNTAEPKLWSLNAGSGLLEPSYRQGAGMLQISRALFTNSSVTPSKIALGEGTGGTRTLTITNRGSTAVTYALSHVGSVGTGPNTFALSFFGPAGTASFSAPNVTVPAGGTATVDVNIGVSPLLADKSLYGGYIVLTAPGGDVLRVPYVGFKGDYQSIQAVTPGGTCNFPALVQLRAGQTFCNLAGVQRIAATGGTFTMQGSDIPIVLYHLDHQVRKLNWQVYKSDGSAVHPVFNYAGRFEFHSRNSTATSFFEFDWDGMRSQDNGRGNGDHRKVVPNGTYVLKMSALKALGDESNAAHWETWTSPPITLARP